MNLELVSFKLCPFVHRVTTLLLEKDIPYSVRYIDLKNKPDWFLAISPKGRVPVLVADGQPLYESAAILEFVDETHSPPMLPSDPFERARQRALISFAGDVFMAVYRVAIAVTVEEQQAADSALLGQLGTFEQAIGDAEYLGGAKLGLADVALAPALYRLLLLERSSRSKAFGELAKMRRLAERMADRPSVVRGVPEDFESLFLESVKR